MTPERTPLQQAPRREDFVTDVEYYQALDAYADKVGVRRDALYPISPEEAQRIYGDLANLPPGVGGVPDTFEDYTTRTTPTSATTGGGAGGTGVANGTTLQDYGQWLASRTQDEIRSIFGETAPTFAQWQSYISGGAVGGQGGQAFDQPVARAFQPSAAPPVGSPAYAPFIEETTGDPRSGYLAGLGLYGNPYQTPFQQYQASQFDPISLLHGLQAP